MTCPGSNESVLQHTNVSYLPLYLEREVPLLPLGTSRYKKYRTVRDVGSTMS